MTRKEALQELLVKVKAGCAPEYSILREAYVKTSWQAFDMKDQGVAWGSYNGSMDSAISLFEAVLPGLPVQITDTTQDYLGSVGWAAKVNWPHMEYKPTFTGTGPFAHVGYAETPSRALLIAILEALVAKEGDA